MRIDLARLKEQLPDTKGRILNIYWDDCPDQVDTAETLAATLSKQLEEEIATPLTMDDD